MNALVLTRVCKTRGAGARAVRALADVSLRLTAGEIALLEGPSGSGKTTLLTVAAGLLTPDEGTVEIAGTLLHHSDRAQRVALRARHVGFVFQRANLLEGLTVRDNVRLAGALAGMSRRECEAETSRLLEILGIADLADRYPATLSGGEEHRAAVARGVVHRPAVLLADEPTGNLDGASGRAVADAIRHLATSHGVAVLLATHDARLRRIGDRCLRLVDGRLADGPLADGPPENSGEACA